MSLFFGKAGFTALPQLKTRNHCLGENGCLRGWLSRWQLTMGNEEPSSEPENEEAQLWPQGRMRRMAARVATCTATITGT